VEQDPQALPVPQDLPDLQVRWEQRLGQQVPQVQRVEQDPLVLSEVRVRREQREQQVPQVR
jgi:hypothetical protein